MKLLNYLKSIRYGQYAVVGVPFTWLLLFFLLPFLFVFKISFAEAQLSIPPYSDLFNYLDDKLEVFLNVGSYLYLVQDDLYASSYLLSIRTAAISTLLCLLIGYPTAWAIVHSKPATRNVLLMLIILPSWTSFLIRVYALIGLLKNNGLLNNLLMSIGIITFFLSSKSVCRIIFITAFSFYLYLHRFPVCI